MAYLNLWRGVAPVFQDTFARGAFVNANAQRGYKWGNGQAENSGASPVPFITAANPRPGSQSRNVLRFRFSPNGVAGWAAKGITFGEYLDELWVQYYSFTPLNYFHAGFGGTLNHKVWTMWRDVYGSGGGDEIMDMECNPPLVGPANGKSRLDAQANTSTDNTVANIIAPQLDPTATTTFIGAGCVMDLGVWSQVRHHAKAASVALAFDGVYEMWINGNLYFQKTNVGFPGQGGDFISPAGMGSKRTWRRFNIWGSTNLGPFTETTDIDLSDLQVWNRNPQWSN